MLWEGEQSNSFNIKQGLNPQKSKVLVFGSKAPPPSTSWSINGEKLEAVKEYLHLGILRSTTPSTLNRSLRHINSGRSSFFALNRAGTRFGCLHPITALRLYTSIALPRMLYGAEIWCHTNTELEMLERAHRKPLEKSKGSLLDVLRKSLVHFSAVQPSQTLLPIRNSRS